MTVDIFAQHPFGKAALKKMGAVPENFRLYCAGWIGENPEEWKCMDVTGAEFRRPLRGSRQLLRKADQIGFNLQLSP